MFKSGLIKAVAKDAGLTQKDVGKVLASLEKTFVETLESGEEVQLIGFMTAKPVAKAARKGRNPGKGILVDIPAKVGVAITPGKSLKDAVGGLKYEDFQK
ncbi:HU family DNA-binding protein [Bacillus massiliglaciei]|uniref:HU family DNA-binding protein n=1 Tax=Bacillus massiliglaciei TaxID=1816693 RepID=UPI000DA6051F|nr:HU family DNA-binding protein [Bacillus massiliglaciei]